MVEFINLNKITDKSLFVGILNFIEKTFNFFRIELEIYYIPFLLLEILTLLCLLTVMNDYFINFQIFLMLDLGF